MTNTNYVVTEDIEEFNCLHDQFIAIYNGWSEQDWFIPTLETDVFTMNSNIYNTGFKFVIEEKK